MTDPVYTVKWTETALNLAECFPDRWGNLLRSRRVDELANSPEHQGSLVGELAGLRSVRAVGQRFRIVYRVEQKEIVVMIVAVGRRKEGDKKDIYALAKKLLRLELLRGTYWRMTVSWIRP